MPAPPLWKDSPALSESVVVLCDTGGLDLAERRAALEVLGEVIASGETSYVQCLRRVADVIRNDRERIAAMAERHRDGAAARSSGQTGAKPDPQTRMRWDQDEND